MVRFAPLKMLPEVATGYDATKSEKSTVKFTQTLTWPLSTSPKRATL